MRAFLLVTVAAVSLVVPALSSSAAATCWIDCRPGPVPVPLPSSESEPDAPSSCEFPVDGLAAAVPIDPFACPPARRWVCCSPPGGPVCCTPPGGGAPICYGGDLDEEEFSSGVEIEACAFETVVADAEPVLECRADEVEPWLATVLSGLLTMWA